MTFGSISMHTASVYAGLVCAFPVDTVVYSWPPKGDLTVVCGVAAVAADLLGPGFASCPSRGCLVPAFFLFARDSFSGLITTS